MKTITLSTYLSGNGTRLYCVLSNGQQVSAATTDEQGQTEYARQLYHLLDGPKQYVLWDGVKGQSTTLEMRAK